MTGRNSDYSDYGDYGECSEGMPEVSILDLIQQETNLSFRKTSTAGKQYNGPCPWCGDDGKGHKADRFIIWPAEGRYLCRRCGKKGDDIQFVREHKNMGYTEACEYLNFGSRNNHHNHHNDNVHHNHHNHEQPLLPPAEQWLEQAWPFLISCQESLWGDAGARALAWLRSRGLTDETICAAGLGYCDHDHYTEREAWGVAPETTKDGRPKGLWLPRGVVIPWLVDGELWGVRIRRPDGYPKYYLIPGGQASGLFNADQVKPGEPAVIVEGEIDALTICQADYTAVATGSTHGARRTRWIARLSTASTVLVAYDNDDAGNGAAAYWLEVLPNAKRWRPYWSDANQLQQDGVSVAAWIAAGLGAEIPTVNSDRPPIPGETLSKVDIADETDAEPAPEPAAKAPAPTLSNVDIAPFSPTTLTLSFAPASWLYGPDGSTGEEYRAWLWARMNDDAEVLSDLYELCNLYYLGEHEIVIEHPHAKILESAAQYILRAQSAGEWLTDDYEEIL